jgi:uncharacterized protein YndB with AHSA1/START domain
MVMLWYILLGLVAVIVVFLLIASRRPSEFRITRTGVINAAPEAVFPHVNDFHLWQEWSPWAKRDPNCEIAYDGPSSGEGAKFAWNGNKEVGKGKMTIIESSPHKRIAIRLEFLKPFKAINTAEFKFEPEGNGTQVTWSMFGKNNFMGKIFNMIIDCDKMVGKDFEQGLANLKSVAESSPPVVAAAH